MYSPRTRPVLGIDGHSPYPDDLMYAIQDPDNMTPSASDLNTARTAYQQYFGNRSISPVPLAELMDPSALVKRTIN